MSFIFAEGNPKWTEPPFPLLVALQKPREAAISLPGVNLILPGGSYFPLGRHFLFHGTTMTEMQTEQWFKPKEGQELCKGT